MPRVSEHAHSQCSSPARAGLLGPGEPFLEEVHHLLEVFAQPPAHGCEGNAPADAVEQRDAEAAFLPADGLADAGLGHAQPLGGAAEVQLLGRRQEDLCLAQLHA